MSAPEPLGLRARIVVERPRFRVDVAVDAAAGETVAVMGPSGAGKSTLLEALAGLTALAAGEIAVDGRVVDRVAVPRTRVASRDGGASDAGAASRVRTAPMHRGVVLLGQDARLFPHLTAAENVAFGPRAAGVRADRARADAHAWLERVGLPGAGDRRPAELSGGEQQRVAVARALAASPRVVLLDEPLVALDPETAGAIRGMLRDQLVRTTVVAVTHDAADAVALADRLVVIESGRVTQSGAVRAVLAAPASRFVASIAGLNRLEGVVAGGAWQASGAGIRLESADAASRALAMTDGVPLAAVFRPADVRIVSDAAIRMNAWATAIERIEPTLAGVRVHTRWGAVDTTLAEASGRAPGDALRLHVDPAHVRFVAAP